MGLTKDRGGADWHARKLAVIAEDTISKVVPNIKNETFKNEVF